VALRGEHDGRQRGRPAIDVPRSLRRAASRSGRQGSRSQVSTVCSRLGRAGCTGYRSSAATRENSRPAHRTCQSRTGRKLGGGKAVSQRPPEARAGRTAARRRPPYDRSWPAPIASPAHTVRLGSRATAPTVGMRVDPPRSTNPRHRASNGGHHNCRHGPPPSDGAVDASNGGGTKGRRHCRPNASSSSLIPCRRCAAHSNGR